MSVAYPSYCISADHNTGDNQARTVQYNPNWSTDDQRTRLCNDTKGRIQTLRKFLCHPRRQPSATRGPLEPRCCHSGPAVCLSQNYRDVSSTPRVARKSERARAGGRTICVLWVWLFVKANPGAACIQIFLSMNDRWNDDLFSLSLLSQPVL